MTSALERLGIPRANKMSIGLLHECDIDKGKGTQNILRCHLLSITPNAQRRVELNIKEWDGRERKKAAATCVTGRKDG